VLFKFTTTRRKRREKREERREKREEMGITPTYPQHRLV
jgi:hypothetical protein